MITVDSLIKLLYCSFPVFVIVMVIFFVIVKISKEKSISFDYTHNKLFGMRSPTDEEAVIKDQIGTCRESDLTKDLFNVTVGTSCLVIIFDTEDKINRSRRNGRPLYRRAIYVPRDELCF